MAGRRRVSQAIAVVSTLAAASSGAPATPWSAVAAREFKRGVASARFLTADPVRLDRLGAHWAYNWSATPPPAGGPPWVPMIWGPGSLTPRTLARLAAERRAGRIAYLLGFNEPDSRSQSNLSPERAAALWPQLERTGLKLGSPAPAVPTDGWLTSFMALVASRHLRVDFLALHYYQDFTNPSAVSELRRQLISLHDEFRKPIWITEVGALDLGRWGEPMTHPPSAAKAVSYMRRLFAMLDKLQFIQRYAWFTDYCWRDPGCRLSSLFGPGPRLTAAGRAFQRGG